MAKYSMPLNDLKKITQMTIPEIRSDLEQIKYTLSPSQKYLDPDITREYLKYKGTSFLFNTVALINLKGGVGKTTSAISIASRAAQYGFKTCILDMDSQGSASLAFDCIPPVDAPIFFDVWSDPGEMVLDSLWEIEENLFILPSALENGLLDSILINPVNQKKAVKGVIDELEKNDFDLVIVDCSPSLGTAVISTICAVKNIIIPVGSDHYSLKGLDLTMSEIQSICDTFGLTVPEISILFTKFDRRENLSEISLEKIAKKYPNQILSTVIPTSTIISQALGRRETIFVMPGIHPVKDQYDELTRNLLDIRI